MNQPFAHTVIACLLLPGNLVSYPLTLNCGENALGGTLAMAGPKETIWKAEPHTLAKHAILRHYLGAWFPILSRWQRRVVYYDGFAGPGRYIGGEEGSPLIALNVARNHRTNLHTELVFVFVERDPARAEHLKSEIDAMQLPGNIKWRVQNEEFESALRRTLDRLDAEGLKIAPTFAFIDPFGITGLPFELIRRLLARDQCEILVTFMNETIQRFVTELPEQINDLVGQPDAAKEIAGFQIARDRVVRARQLYQESLRTAGQFVRFFEMRDSNNRPIYDLFFASNHSLGHVRMKEAMWRIDEGGQYSFSDGADPNQATLFTPVPGRDYAPTLWEHFRGRTVYSDEIITYTCDETPYLETHAKSALKLLEQESGVEGHHIEVAEKKRDGSLRRKRTYPSGTCITFMD